MPYHAEYDNNISQRLKRQKYVNKTFTTVVNPKCIIIIILKSNKNFRTSQEISCL